MKFCNFNIYLYIIQNILFVVNDSGIVAASTAAIYVLIPIIIIGINMIIFDKEID